MGLRLCFGFLEFLDFFVWHGIRSAAGANERARSETGSFRRTGAPIRQVVSARRAGIMANVFSRLASAAVISAVSLAGVSVPVAAQGKAQREPRAERVQKDKVRRTNVEPDSATVDRKANRSSNRDGSVREPKVDREVRQPRVVNQEPVTREPKADRRARQPKDADRAPVVREPKERRNDGRIRTTGRADVEPGTRPGQKNTKPLPSRRIEPSDGAIDRRSATVDRNRNPRAARVSDAVQRTRIDEGRSRVSKYNQYLINQNRLADQRREQLRQQRRIAQARYMEDYWRRLAQQQARVSAWNRYDYYNDPYYYTPASYRYNCEGRWYETNQYGRNLLEQAVNEGYREGYYAGRADREDRWRYNYQSSYAYQDANWGYDGYYVPQSTYNYYFRQGFERGYEDGYYSRSRYGNHTGTTIAILAGVIGTILVLDAIND